MATLELEVVSDMPLKVSDWNILRTLRLNQNNFNLRKVTKMVSCQICGSQLGPEQNCPACMLELGVSKAGGAADFSSDAGNQQASLDEINAQFSQLQITRLIGRGGMGAIYHARQTNLDRDVALKVIAREIAGDSTFVDRFEREAKTLARLSHPNIVTVYDFGHTSDGQVYLVMEYVDGINLREAMQQGSLPIDEVVDTVRSIANALDYAHRRGVIHRDIKPENILLGEDGILKVADFGIAKIIDDSVRTPTLTATRQVLGSLHYLAPEHLEKPQQVDHRVDLYALGVIFYELLTGQLPLGRFETPRALRRDVTEELDSMVMQLLSRNPGDRYQTASDLLDALRVLDSSVGDTRSEFQQSKAAPNSTPPSSSKSVPFTCDAIAGLTEAVGIIYTEQDKDRQLNIEYRIRDAIFGSLKSQTQVVEIPFEKLTRAKLSKGLFGSKLTLMTNTISSLGNLPNAETGSVDLQIKRADHVLAEDLLAAIGLSDSQPSYPEAKDHLRSSRSTAPPDRATSWLTLSLLLLLSGIINIGFLFALEYIAATTLASIHLVTVAVTYAVLIGPIACFQLCSGLYTLLRRKKSVAMTASVLSMLPTAPAWPISFPLGLWGYLWLRKEPAEALTSRSFGRQAAPLASTASSDSKDNWGTTTMLFLRESRWGRVVAVANGLAFAMIVAGLFVYRLGYYPSSLTLRIVNSEVDDEMMAKPIEERLSDLSNVQFEYGKSRSRINLSLWQYQQQPARERLAIEGGLEFVWLLPASPASDGMPDNDQRRVATSKRMTAESQTANSTGNATYDIADVLVLPAGFAIQSKMGSIVHAYSSPIALAGDKFAAISASDSDGGETFGIRFELTSKGKSALEAGAPELGDEADAASSSFVLGLLDDGLLIGIAEPNRTGARTLEFEVARRSNLSAAAIQAAARGPVIPSQLEVIP